ARAESLAIPALVVAATAVAFLPVLGNDLVGFDDRSTLVANAAYRGLSPSHLAWMFTTFHMGHYQPLSWLTYAIDWTIWGLRPVGFHLTNLALHAANALLVYALAIRVLRRGDDERGERAVRLAAAAAALVFALHPLRVEAVAWATERRDVLSAFFVLL